MISYKKIYLSKNILKQKTLSTLLYSHRHILKNLKNLNNNLPFRNPLKKNHKIGLITKFLIFNYDKFL